MSILRLKPIFNQSLPPRDSCAELLPAKNPPRWQRSAPRLPIRQWKHVTSATSGGGLSGTISRRVIPVARSGVAQASAEDTDVLIFSKTFPLQRTKTVEGKITVKLDSVLAEEEVSKWQLVVECNMEGNWILHWGVSYRDDSQSEWDQPPLELRPAGSIPIKDYAIETPLKKSSSTLEGNTLHRVQIDIDVNTDITAIHFVLKELVTGAWFQHKGRDFRIPLTSYVEKDNTLGGTKSFSIWPGAVDQLSSLLLRTEGSSSKLQGSTGEMIKQQNKHSVGFYEEFPLLKEELVEHNLTVSVRKSNEKGKSLVQFDTDIPGNLIVHWGVCKDSQRIWEIPSTPHPPKTKVFRNKALQTLLQPKLDRPGSLGSFQVDKGIFGMLFVLKLNEIKWFDDMGTDFFIPIASMGSTPTQTGGQESEAVDTSNEIIKEIRNLVTDISLEKIEGTISKEAQVSIMLEIEKLAAEAYSIFRNFTSDVDQAKPTERPCPGTGSGYEILCQGFNWESHKSGRWYSELNAKTKELASLGFTIIWLPPPTESVSPEGYMPKDYYNLNSRYGTIEELKEIVEKFHEAGIKVLGDAVLNHRCAHYQNQNGIWNIFGGRLSWDDRAVVADDPHFQGRGNKSSGDNFHAAPNIDHSQEFVRKDLKEWLCWLRKEVGYDGWRLDFVRGFWGGYVKDYMEASEPYFAVGEYWDSLSYTYGEMDYNQDAHRQRIIDWINATDGDAGAFDVTTKGILHTALGKCEYWRLSDQNGKPPGVVGWWPSRAVTFIENHDTGSTQGHWRFPSGKEMQGYAYILTHPGTPCVFYDHIFSHYQQELSRLISIRKRKNINCRSMVKITKVERDVYAANIDEKIAMKIGPGHYEPSADGSGQWVVAAEGNDYKVWEKA